MTASATLPAAMSGEHPNKYPTALRIAMNIAIGDDALQAKPAAEWTRDELYAHLQKVWSFHWDEELEKWEQR